MDSLFELGVSQLKSRYSYLYPKTRSCVSFPTGAVVGGWFHQTQSYSRQRSPGAYSLFPTWDPLCFQRGRTLILELPPFGRLATVGSQPVRRQLYIHHVSTVREPPAATARVHGLRLCGIVPVLAIIRMNRFRYSPRPPIKFQPMYLC